MSASAAKARSKNSSPDLSDFRKRYPLTVAGFASIANREQWLRRIWESDREWLTNSERRSDRECVVRTAPPSSLRVDGEFEVIYAGGVLGLLHGAVLSATYHRRVLIFDEQIGIAGRVLNLSKETLSDLESSGLFTRAELDAVIMNRYRTGFVKFHDAASRIKAPPLEMNELFDASVDADRLLSLAVEKVRKSQTNSEVLEHARFIRCYLRSNKVSVEVEDTRTGKHRLFSARLLVDSTGASSPVSQQLNGGTTVLRPTVGTIAKGFVRGSEPDQTDFDKAEILVSNGDASDHRQMLWEGFGGNAQTGEFATSLFFYDSVDSRADKSLFSLFERYFETLPNYKRAGAQWRVLKPYFGHHPGLRPGGKGNRRRTAADNLLLIGDAASAAGTFSSGGLVDAHARSLGRVTHLTELALKANLLEAESLAQINEGERSVSQLAGFRALMSPAVRSAPSAVNESMNAVMAALHESDDSVRQDFFRDRLSTSGFKNLFVRTLKLYPRILQQVREHFGTRGTLWWLAGIAETMFNERRNKNRSEGNEIAPDANARDEFARYVTLYQNKHHADKP